MAVATMRVPTVFTAVDRFSDVVSKMTRKTTAFGKVGSSAISRMDHRLNNMWGSMNNISQLAIGGGVGGLFYYAGKDVMDYETKIASLAAVTGTKIGAMNSQIEDLGKRTKMSVIDVAGAFEIVGSKMSQYLDNPDALKKVTDASITMSRAARMELEPAIQSLTGVMNIYKMTSEDAARVVNKLSAGETVGSVSIAQTSDILTQFGAQAVRANVSIEQSIALIQALTKSMGVEGVGRGLRNILFDISSTETWDKNRWRAIRMAGVDFKFVTDNAQDLTKRLMELKKLQSTKGAMELFFKRTGTVAANTLFQNFNVDGYTDFLGKIENLNDAADKAGKNTSTLSSMIDKLKATFTNFVVTNNDANGALGMTKSLIGWMTDNMGTLIGLVEKLFFAFVGWKSLVGLAFLFKTISKGVLALKAALKLYRIAQLGAAISGNSTIGVLLGLSPAIGAAIPPLLAITAVIGGLAYTFYRNNETMKRFAESNKTTFNLVTKQTVGSLDTIISKMDKAIAKIKELNHAQSLLVKTPEEQAKTKKKMDLVLSADALRLSKEVLTSKNQNILPKYKQDFFMKKGVNIMQDDRVRRGQNDSPSNLSGQTDSKLDKFFEAFAREKILNLNISTSGGVEATVEGKVPQGITVKTSKNQGSN